MNHADAADKFEEIACIAVVVGSESIVVVVGSESIVVAFALGIIEAVDTVDIVEVAEPVEGLLIKNCVPKTLLYC